MKAWTTSAIVAALLVLAPGAFAEERVFQRTSEYPGTQGDASFLAASSDGSRVFFSVRTPACPQDGYTDSIIYVRSANVTTVVSTGPDGQPHCASPGLQISDDGSHAFFVSRDKLAAGDTDNLLDIYERSGGVTSLVSTGPSDPQTATYFFWDLGNPGRPKAFSISTDGARVYFAGTDGLVPSDTNGTVDLYERAGGSTTLVSARPDGSAAGAGPALPLKTVTSNGVFFDTTTSLDPADTNVYDDIYQRAGGVTTLVSNWPHGGGIQTPQLSAASTDGSRLIVGTASPLMPQDTDSETDLYALEGGTTTLLSTGTGSFESARAYFRSATPDAQSVWFIYADPNGPLYAMFEASNGAVTEIPVNDGRGYFVGQAGNGVQTFFGTTAQLVPEDTDTRVDLYRYAGGVSTLVSVGPTGGNGLFDVQPGGRISADGARVFFVTAESLVPEDTDPNTNVASSNGSDVYERQTGATTLVSGTPSQSPTQAGIGGITADGARVWFTTTDNFGTDTNGKVDVYESVPLTDTGGYARPKGATPIFAALVPAFQPCAVPNRAHGSPLAFGSCAPPGLTSPNLTVGTADSNGQAPGMVGSVAVNAVPGDPATPADEADLHFQLSVKDVRRQSDLADYTGGVKVQTSVRLTDKDSSVPNTTADFPISFTASCISTASTSIGSTCAAVTTAEALAPGSVVESARSIWGLGQIEVYDGGPDGDPATAGNSLFAVQGVFVP